MRIRSWKDRQTVELAVEFSCDGKSTDSNLSVWSVKSTILMHRTCFFSSEQQWESRFFTDQGANHNLVLLRRFSQKKKIPIYQKLLLVWLVSATCFISNLPSFIGWISGPSFPDFRQYLFFVRSAAPGKLCRNDQIIDSFPVMLTPARAFSAKLPVKRADVGARRRNCAHGVGCTWRHRGRSSGCRLPSKV